MNFQRDDECFFITQGFDGIWTLIAEELGLEDFDTYVVSLFILPTTKKVEMLARSLACFFAYLLATNSLVHHLVVIDNLFI